MHVLVVGGVDALCELHQARKSPLGLHHMKDLLFIVVLAVQQQDR